MHCSVPKSAPLNPKYGTSHFSGLLPTRPAQPQVMALKQPHHARHLRHHVTQCTPQSHILLYCNNLYYYKCFAPNIRLQVYSTGWVYRSRSNNKNK